MPLIIAPRHCPHNRCARQLRVTAPLRKHWLRSDIVANCKFLHVSCRLNHFRPYIAYYTYLHPVASVTAAAVPAAPRCSGTAEEAGTRLECLHGSHEWPQQGGNGCRLQGNGERTKGVLIGRGWDSVSSCQSLCRIVTNEEMASH
eukprot:141120-Rhodomonas_salina.1